MVLARHPQTARNPHQRATVQEKGPLPSMVKHHFQDFRSLCEDNTDVPVVYEDHRGHPLECDIRVKEALYVDIAPQYFPRSVQILLRCAVWSYLVVSRQREVGVHEIRL